MDKLPIVSDEELAAWEQSTGEYLNRYAAKRLMFTVRDLRAKLTAAEDGYPNLLRCMKGHIHNTGYGEGCPACKLAASEADVRLLRKACRALALEAQGFRAMADRQSHGNTNIQVMTLKIKEAFEACSAAPDEQEKL